MNEPREGRQWRCRTAYLSATPLPPLLGSPPFPFAFHGLAPVARHCHPSGHARQATGASGRVPEGRMRVAQRFSAGIVAIRPCVPAGRLKAVRRTSGTRQPHPHRPTIETVGSYRLSLRDSARRWGPHGPRAAPVPATAAGDRPLYKAAHSTLKRAAALRSMSTSAVPPFKGMTAPESRSTRRFARCCGPSSTVNRAASG